MINVGDQVMFTFLKTQGEAGVAEVGAMQGEVLSVSVDDEENALLDYPSNSEVYKIRTKYGIYIKLREELIPITGMCQETKDKILNYSKNVEEF